MNAAIDPIFTVHADDGVCFDVTEPLPHSTRCLIAMSCGHPRATCVCTQRERQHDWMLFLQRENKTDEAMLEQLNRFHGALAQIERTERDIHGSDRCLFCAEIEDGP